MHEPYPITDKTPLYLAVATDDAFWLKLPAHARTLALDALPVSIHTPHETYGGRFPCAVRVPDTADGRIDLATIVWVLRLAFPDATDVVTDGATARKYRDAICCRHLLRDIRRALTTPHENYFGDTCRIPNDAWRYVRTASGDDHFWKHVESSALWAYGLHEQMRPYYVARKELAQRRGAIRHDIQALIIGLDCVNERIAATET